MGAVIGYLFLLIFVLAVCALIVAGVTWVVKKLIFEIKILDGYTADDVKLEVSRRISKRRSSY